MLKFRYLLLFFLISSNVFAQNKHIDSLLSSLKKSKSDVESVKILGDIVYKYSESQPDSVIFYGEQRFHLASKINDQKSLVNSINSIANAYDTKSDYQKSLEYNLKALKISEKNKFTTGIMTTLNNIGVLYEHTKEYDKSLKFFKRVLIMAHQQNNKENISLGLNNIGDIYYDLNDYSKSLYYHQQSLKINKELHDDYSISYNLYTIGLIYGKQGNYQKSLENLLECLKLRNNSRNKESIAYASYEISEIYNQMGNTRESLKYANQALRIAREIGSQDIIMKAGINLSNSYKTLKDFKNALYYDNVADTARSKQFSIEKEKAMSAMQSSYDIEKKQKQIEILNINNDLQREELKKQAVLRNSLIAGFAGLALVAALLFITISNKQKANRLLQNQNFEINKQKEDIMCKSEEIILQKEQFSLLNATKDKLFSIISHDLRSPIHSLQGTLLLYEQSLISKEETTEILMSLAGKVNDTSNLLDNLLYWAKSQMEGITVKTERINIKAITDEYRLFLQKPADDKGIIISSGILKPVYALADKNMIQLVVRNLISNAIKYSHPGDTIKIDVAFDHEFVTISVCDTGIGISEDDQNKLFNVNTHFTRSGTAKEKGTGLGLLLCKDFVERNKGEIWVESQLELGSTFFFKIPLAEFETKIKNNITVNETVDN